MLAVMALAAPAMQGQVFSTVEQVLARRFPGRAIDRKTLFLSEAERADIEQRAKTNVESRIITYYVPTGSAGPEAYVFFDTHTVRTMPETFMVVIRPDSTVGAVEILAFHEPSDYLPPPRWLALLEGWHLSDDFWIKRGIPNITGATLSARAINEGVRRFLSVFISAVPKEERR